ncbi:hypothetical protein PPL_12551 [Heterostelium album PN500]|uniref:Uncharacterized protein n=1 Tax=Heterostelium pallidum (strain ATCC 26659 / Pp 5 / PN500) TaxID=670386 RepID=D3BMX8_HETP5|nr:hypothetical protein PPL_12551 [Heterostelium album PN500]EFA77340.1 hypothetical protein PPL_12551 [Heterostelium album PN500]|eukprot:XP_020429469.1 hypothetical protein PPL_12551 [Heterostelium album PN500]
MMSSFRQTWKMGFLIVYSSNADDNVDVANNDGPPINNFGRYDNKNEFIREVENLPFSALFTKMTDVANNQKRNTIITIDNRGPTKVGGFSVIQAKNKTTMKEMAVALVDPSCQGKGSSPKNENKVLNKVKEALIRSFNIVNTVVVRCHYK